MTGTRTPVAVMMRYLAKPMLLLALAAYLIAATGVLPSAGAVAGWLGLGLDVSGLAGRGAFPCQGHLCGCTSIDDCRNNCCCFSAEEIARWEQGVAVRPERVCRGEACDEGCEEVCGEVAAEPECPLCEIDPFGSEAPDDAQPSPITISPLKCKGIQLLMLVSAPVATRGAEPSVPEMRQAGVLTFLDPHDPRHHLGEGLDPPPPRG